MRTLPVIISLLLLVFVVSCSGGGEEGTNKETTQTSPQLGVAKPVQKQRSACDLITKAEVEKITGIPVLNVALRDRGSFTSCSYETENWEKTTGVIYYPGLNPVANSAALAEEIRKDLERDQAPYNTPEPFVGIAEASAYYSATDGDLHTIVAQKDGERIIVSAKSRTAVTELIKAALASM